MMQPFPHKSPLQLQVGPQGASIEGLPGLRAHTIQEEHPVRDWLAELSIPKDWARIDEMAVPRGLSRRHFECVIADSSSTKFPGNPRFNISKWTYTSGGLYLELGHLGRYIGVLEHIWLGSPSKVRTVEPPFIVAQATFYESELAERAWQGLQRGIFTHVSPVVWLPMNEPTGPAALLSAGLTDGPSCDNARVLRVWEE